MSSAEATATPVELHPEAFAGSRRRAAWRSGYARRLLIVDVIVVVAAVVVAQWLRFGGLPGVGTLYRAVDYPTVSAGIIVAWLLFLAIYRTRSPRIIGAGAEEYRRLFNATLSVFGAIAIVSMLFKLDIARGYLAIALPLGIVGLVLGRWLTRGAVTRSRRRSGRYMTPMLAVGEPRAIRDLAQSMAREAGTGYHIVGACVPGHYTRGVLEVAGVGSIPIHGGEDSIVAAVGAAGADAVALTATERLGHRGIRDLSWDLEKLDVDLVVSPGVVDVAGPRLLMRPVAGLPLIHVEKPQYNGAKRFEKRVFDVGFALLVLVTSLPLTLLIAAAVKLTSRGPVFYLSERIGLDGMPFKMAKFRTMVVDADQRVGDLAALNESKGGVLFKIKEDPRVTPLGRILRRYSLDELPQFINVLRRDMSVVGPRPPLAREVDAYDDEVRRRLLVRPGITGLWQVSGRSDLSWEDSVRLDLFYVENWSMMADFVIVVKTVMAMLRGSGAY
jgi:exopolysaccharide biosynthesis polyprenyl glycosylphosphotransferase